MSASSALPDPSPPAVHPPGTSAGPQSSPYPGADASLDDLLAFVGNRYDLAFEAVSAGGASLSILQIANMRELLDAAIAQKKLRGALTDLPLWAKIWPASLLLGHSLAAVSPDGHSLLEIGAGCGVAGLLAAALGFRVCITDINPDALLFARINVLKNNLGERVRIRRLDMESGRLDERFSLILGSEILYLEHLYRPLVKFLKKHLRPGDEKPLPAALLASDHRRDAARFFKLAEKEFRIGHRTIGLRAKSEPVRPEQDGPERAERHLLGLHRLTPLH